MWVRSAQRHNSPPRWNIGTTFAKLVDVSVESSLGSTLYSKECLCVYFVVTLTKIVMSRLAWEMAQWEVHALRGLVGILVVNTQLHARSHPEANALAAEFVQYKKSFEANQLEALVDPVKRGSRE